MAIAAGMMCTWIILKIWKQYEVSVAASAGGKQKATKTAVCILSLLLSCILSVGEDTAVTYLNVLMVYVLLTAMAGIDYNYKRIPNKLLLAGMICRTFLLLLEVLQTPDRIKDIMRTSLLGLLFGFLLLLFLCIISRHAIGFGDVKLFAWLGYCFGRRDTGMILFYGMLIAAVAGLYMMIIKKAGRKKTLPLAPFFCLGAYVVMIMKMFE